jgi:tetratricopeptide (TPR) repeat protein
MNRILILILVLFFGFGAIFVISRTMESVKPKTDDKFVDEDLYFSAPQLAAFGHDFRGLMADWYWINSLQYLGDKALKQEFIDINDLRPLNPRLLYPMLDTASTLDPQFITVYSYGASVLPAIDTIKAIKLLEKGISANPENWRLYHNLGYIYWQMKNYPKAAEIYATGATKPDAPNWMKQISVSMQAQGGSRDFALQLYRQMFETADDEQTKTFAELRYMQVVSLNERDLIRPALEKFQMKNGRCLSSWREVYSDLRNLKDNAGKPLNFDKNLSPLDPMSIPYLIISKDNKCDLDLDWKNSKIPRQ